MALGVLFGMKVCGLDLSKKALAQMMDFSELEPASGKDKLLEACRTAREYGFKGLHVNQAWAPLVARELEGTGIETGWVISYPSGTNETAVKIAEAKRGAALLSGRPWVVEMVANAGLLRSGDHAGYRRDIAEVTRIAHDNGAECKVIVEECLLTDEELGTACLLAAEAGVDWVKTSSGRERGPSMERVRRMREVTPTGVKVKAAGLGSYWTPLIALGCILAGAERIGTRKAPWVVDELSGMVADLLKAK